RDAADVADAERMLRAAVFAPAEQLRAIGHDDRARALDDPVWMNDVAAIGPQFCKRLGVAVAPGDAVGGRQLLDGLLGSRCTLSGPDLPAESRPRRHGRRTVRGRWNAAARQRRTPQRLDVVKHRLDKSFDDLRALLTAGDRRIAPRAAGRVGA